MCRALDRPRARRSAARAGGRSPTSASAPTPRRTDDRHAGGQVQPARAERRERAEARAVRDQPARRRHALRRRGQDRGDLGGEPAAREHADRIGLDAIVPVARWRGYGGRSNLGERSFETFTWATGLLARTRAHPGLRDLPRAARPPRARGEDGRDRRPRLRRALRPEHRRRLVRRRALDVRPRAARARRALRGRRRVGAGAQAALDGRTASATSTAATSTSPPACSSPSRCRSPTR